VGQYLVNIQRFPFEKSLIIRGSQKELQK